MEFVAVYDNAEDDDDFLKEEEGAEKEEEEFGKEFFSKSMNMDGKGHS